MIEQPSFKLEIDIAYPLIYIGKKYFNSLKTLNQWLKRNESVSIFGHRKYILTDSGYQRFHIFGNTIVPLSELQQIVQQIEKSEKENVEFAEMLKNQSIQIAKSEE
ncbi:hypothetical protein M2451_003872 [Dysgonomonas sp. PFB1-18]|uniref:hypothetical protein n=1 Tax=unclassified Dysgonomonas TaxID=2630389 RepID=UPI002473F2D3|nr:MULTISPECIES: hypothetical protein [unclassified Dysgonomonas]MDH6311213.1 hypothetical protein [Dysgonomonas sp. PF1-14]MDH6341095.1 hypothetical protein [Dysgonomonas sp. PF1-16]MDH6382531.1 hypothetical protein [Dysgonomonas sp. PFB1-18]MDH6399935.1 hypothetical protein [Dysgonomonas sp. PF1-23]